MPKIQTTQRYVSEPQEGNTPFEFGDGAGSKCTFSQKADSHFTSS